MVLSDNQLVFFWAALWPQIPLGTPEDNSVFNITSKYALFVLNAMALKMRIYKFITNIVKLDCAITV